MVDIWDLSRFVEDHPGDYEQRWRLAKKLYLACEYRLALEHLQILRNEWARKLNVVRYLAATLYRLGRYDEAIRELEDAIYTWPEEIGLREQLARVLEVANRNPEAADAWRRSRSSCRTTPSRAGRPSACAGSGIR
jgi:tetratricopeptide (TPR) repeat protein